MNKTEPTVREHRMILIEAAGFGDAEFYGRWLLSTAKAEEVLESIRRLNAEFEEKIEGIEGLYKLDFAAAGALIVTHVGPEFPALAIDIDEECFYADMFCI